jgi:predicted  nucleic acid-binding Zn-ribbon protein
MWEEGLIGAEDYEKGLKRLQNTLDEDIDVEEWEDLADSIQDVAEESEDFDDALKTDKKAAKEVAKEILRFNDAIEDARDNYDDWMKAIKNKTL